MSANTVCTIRIWNYPVCTKVSRSTPWCTLCLFRVTGMVWWPYHGPGVDVEEFAPTPWPVSVITHSAALMRKLQLVPVIRDSPMHTIGDQCQSTKNVMDRDNVDDWLWLWLIEEFCSCVGHLPPPIRLSPAGWREISFRMCTLVHTMMFYNEYVHTGEHWIGLKI